MFRHLKKTMVFKVTILLALGVSLVAISIVSIVLMNGVVDVLEREPNMAFSKDVETHTTIVKDQMLLGFGNVGTYSSDIEELYNQSISENGAVTEEVKLDFLENSVYVMIDMLNSVQTTGAFVILDDNNDTDEYTAVFLRDTAPAHILESQEDLFIQFAPTEIVERFDFETMPLYKPKMPLNGAVEEMVTVPIERELAYPDYKKIGFWQVTANFSHPDQSVMTYSMPLVDKDGNPFGVIGMGITEEYLLEMIPESQFESTGFLGYSLAIHDGTAETLKPVLNFGEQIENKIAPLGEPLEVETLDERLHLYRVISAETEFETVASMYYLALYEDTPFDDTKWVFSGFANNEYLTKSATDFVKSLKFTVIGVIILGAFLAYVFAKKISRPITSLAQKISTNDVEIVHSLEDISTGYEEIDVLAQAIVYFSKREKAASLKTDKIIEMVNLPLGTFEYTKNTDFVVCSKLFIQVLDLPSECFVDNRVDSVTFFSKMDALKKNVENRAENIYMVASAGEQWIKLVSAEDENSIFGICLDVSKETSDRHAIEYERDHDGLTEIFNREAFRRKVEPLFQTEIKGTSAFVMFDIDSLKFMNDTYGHEMGDRYIQAIADVLTLKLEKNGVIARMSGDEFYVFLHQFDSKEDVRANIRAVYEYFDANLLLLPDGKRFRMSMSGGIAWYAEDSSDLDELTQYADFAMYQGKRTTKGEIREFDHKVYLQESVHHNASDELN